MYGHLIQKCKKRLGQEPAVCPNCGENAHGECNKSPVCIHCGEGHPASSKSCTKFIFEKEVQTVRVIEKLSYKDARKKTLEKQVRPGETFSSILKKLKKDIPEQAPSETTRSTEQVSTPAPAEQQNVIVETGGEQSCRPKLNKQNNPLLGTSEQKSQPQRVEANSTITSKQNDSNSLNVAKSNIKNNKKRTLTSEKKDCNKTEKDEEPSSQESIILKRNIHKPKRVKQKLTASDNG